ncbi:c-type cytochrome [Pseudoduganella albidiflava]|uniref:C-type cytochrome n=1 Tax=Pseudoduganella albidiflava TaxID=321983 RepID=A0A411X6N2_9BURK|nr:c-type cytochrome [Pseudoduganella albidiflava]QBI04667.1 c-type cytochrome [Pseudoduganella albidiflava]GGY29080.1 cytochrome c [Pseudoduganella albidiflava]
MKNLRAKLLVLVPAMVLAPLCAPAIAAGPVSAGERLAATCTACHATRNTIGANLPPLAGQPKETLLASLKAFKEGSRPATIMTQLARGYTDEQLEQVAAWFAVQKGDRP